MSQQYRSRPLGSDVALSEAYDTALLDLDGVVYAGGHAIVHAVESLGSAREGGMHLAYVTNNALRTPDAVAEHLTELGVPADATDVITSAQAVARLMADQLPSGARVLVVGGEGHVVPLLQLTGYDEAHGRGVYRLVPVYRQVDGGARWRFQLGGALLFH